MSKGHKQHFLLPTYKYGGGGRRGGKLTFTEYIQC